MKNKKGLISSIVILAIALIFIFWHSYSSYHNKEVEEYCRYINGLISNYDFKTAYINETEITMYDENSSLLYTLPLENYNKRAHISYIRKEDQKMFFVTEAAVDDEAGILIVNDESDKFMDGIYNLKRIGGNSYNYTTYP